MDTTTNNKHFFDKYLSTHLLDKNKEENGFENLNHFFEEEKRR